MRISATFVLEQHLGHRTYADNLRSGLSASNDVAAEWIAVEYANGPAWLRHVPLPGGVRSTLTGRHEVRAGLRKHPADVNVFNTQVPAAIGGRLARSRPYIVVTDVTPVQYDRLADGYGHRPDRRSPLGLIKHRINRRVFTEASWCVGWSTWAKASITEDYGVDPDRVVVIPPGIDTGVWCPGDSSSDGAFRILFVGGDFERKGGRTLLEAFRLLPANAELFLVTKSPVAASGRVHVIDDMGPNDPRLIELYRSCDVFVLPSVAETFGIAAVEASAVGLPIVVTDVGGLSDIVEPCQTGIVVTPGDSPGLAQVLMELEGNELLRRRFSEAGRRRAELLFDAAVNAQRLLDLARRSVMP